MTPGSYAVAMRKQAAYKLKVHHVRQVAEVATCAVPAATFVLIERHLMAWPVAHSEHRAAGMKIETISSDVVEYGLASKTICTPGCRPEG